MQAQAGMRKQEVHLAVRGEGHDDAVRVGRRGLDHAQEAHVHETNEIVAEEVGIIISVRLLHPLHRRLARVVVCVVVL